MKSCRFDALHPGSQGLGAQAIRQFSEFGSGWQGVLLEKAVSSDTSKLAYDEYKDYKHRSRAGARSSISQIMQRKATNMYGGGIYGRGKFPGMPDRGMAASTREQHSEFKRDFASRWDPMRKIANEIFGESKESMRQLRNLPEFIESIQSSMKSSKGELLGTGASARTYGYKGSFSYNKKSYDFDFVAKRARSVEDLMSDPKGVHRMTAGSAAEFNERTRNEFFIQEAVTLSKLEHVEDSLAPSYYGHLNDSVIMERFNVVSPMKKTQMTNAEFDDLTGFMKRAHSKDITHTDLHGENLVRVMTPEGKQQAAVLDWGLASRFNDESGVFGGNVNVIKDVAKQSLGKEVSLKEYSKMADLKRLQAYHAGERDMKHHVGINALMGIDDTKLREAAGEVFKNAGGKHVDLPKPEFFDDWGDMASSSPKKAIPFNQTQQLKAPPLQLTESKTKVEGIKRMQKFNRISERSVGVGLRSAHNASKGHAGYQSVSGASTISNAIEYNSTIFPR